MNVFWNRWGTEYHLVLRDAHRYVCKTSNKKSVHVGDVVLVHDTKPRGFWKLARITKLISGQDGHVRGAVLKVASSNKKPNTLKRPLQRLYPLVLPSLPSTGNNQKSIAELEIEIQADEEKDETVEQTDRPTRAAARMARENVEAITSRNKTAMSTDELKTHDTVTTLNYMLQGMSLLRSLIPFTPA